MRQALATKDKEIAAKILYLRLDAVKQGAMENGGTGSRGFGRRGGGLGDGGLGGGGLGGGGLGGGGFGVTRETEVIMGTNLDMEYSLSNSRGSPRLKGSRMPRK